MDMLQFEKYVQETANELSSEKCSIHHKGATLTASGKEIAVEACCTKFKDEIVEKAKDLIAKKIIGGTSDFIKQAFGN